MSSRYFDLPIGRLFLFAYVVYAVYHQHIIIFRGFSRVFVHFLFGTDHEKTQIRPQDGFCSADIAAHETPKVMWEAARFCLSYRYIIHCKLKYPQVMVLWMFQRM